MSRSQKRLLVVQAAALGHDLLAARSATAWQGLTFKPLEPVFPALTCPAQATFRTGLAPTGHGVVANGFFFRDLGRPLFWEQSAGLVTGARIWDRFRAAGGKVAMLFWQQSLGEAVDAVISPAPIHKHHGGMIEGCHSQPADLYPRLRAAVGADFRLRQYWGPLASAKSSRWIAHATAALLGDADHAPDLCLTYLPALDYDLQRHGPDSAQARQALDELFAELTELSAASTRYGYEMLVFGDYAIGKVAGGAVFPNRLLRAAGLLAARDVNGRLYLDPHQGRAFAVVDHEVAHVYLRAESDRARVAELLTAAPGVGQVLGREEQAALGVAHARSGDLVLVAAPGHWCAYPWWLTDGEAPDYAGHVDIHNKPGYDPCELFFGWPPMSVSRDTARIRGSHGRTGPDRKAAWAATCDLGREPRTLADLAEAVRTWLGEG